MCGRRIEVNTTPFTVRAGGRVKKYPVCDEHRSLLNRLAADFFAQLDDLIASDSEIFGSEDVEGHSASDHDAVENQDRIEDVRRRARRVLSEITVGSHTFRYTDVMMELDRLGYDTPIRLKGKDIEAFEKYYKEGRVNTGLAIQLKN
jgi:hypothetical protein